MNIWIVTIGSSDVQLDSDNKCRKKNRTEKQRSDKIWHYWYDDEVQADCHNIAFEPKQSYKDKDEPYRIETRVLGMVYEASTPEVQKEILSYLTFPLLDNFVGQLKETPLDAITVLLTDQSEIFHSNAERRKPKCPYWQDTCTLKQILKQYFQDKEKFPNAKCVWIPLFPAFGEKGLDDWNYVLDLVRTNLRHQLDSEQIEVDANDKVYVSHQAGTPAISSAIQFVSLAQFRTNVEFLVSNEYDQQTDTIFRSTYLGAIQLQEAKALLDRHDYSGVRDILGLTMATPSNPDEKRIKYLLDAGEQWNFAEFHKFKNILVKRKLLSVSVFPWYQSGYESAYLAWVRLEQGSPVDAMFHSFRALEGLATLYAKRNGRDGLYGRRVFDYLKEQKSEEWDEHPYIKQLICSEVRDQATRNDLLDKRNNLFHQLEGFKKEDLYEAWKATAQLDWKDRVLHCLNFISEQAFPPPLEEASLMFKVHEELKNAIA
ncbi:hypothetical protein [Coleofasciculus sp. FACHB-SPT9]|uniref:hypothetical protein n=1 Tax=Cyanophyceae TaxID=3028117 RepID=UPI0016885B38|nr:hypothetical protein [Coleofasciculus sp. FACHB-SPT9]MBD1889507.1 hypothetical protein [Coleofasciculus sp. FACHB-SPT9]